MCVRVWVRGGEGEDGSVGRKGEWGEVDNTEMVFDFIDWTYTD